MLEFVLFESPQDHFVIGLQALLDNLSVSFNFGNSFVDLFKDGQFLIFIVNNSLKFSDLGRVFLILPDELRKHVLVLMHFVNHGLAKLRHEGTCLRCQVEPQDIEGLEVLGQASCHGVTTSFCALFLWTWLLFL